MKKIIRTLIFAVTVFSATIAIADSSYVVSKSLTIDSLSPSAEFSLLTVSPGDELYNCFGHSAFLLIDTVKNVFKNYNYGTFDGYDPNFYMKFVRGKLLYSIAVEDPRELVGTAIDENRSITKQTLNLTQAQKQQLYTFLENNYLPENRYYKYDFFYDNCSSRLRDALVITCGKSVNFNLKPDKEDKSFRALIDPFLENKRYQDLGMDLGLGLPADKVATPFQYMFLPEHLMNGFTGATILKDGKEEKLVLSQELLLSNIPDKTVTPFYLKPWFLFVLLFIIVFSITYYQYKKQLNGYWPDALLFGISGLFGIVILLLWFATDHGVTTKNYNLIWAVPFHLVAIPLLLLKVNPKLLSSYFLINFFVLFFLLIFWKLVPQELNAATIPFLMALALRSMYIYYRIDKDFVRWKV